MYHAWFCFTVQQISNNNELLKVILFADSQIQFLLPSSECVEKISSVIYVTCSEKRDHLQKL